MENKPEQLINSYHLLTMYHVSDIFMDYLIQSSQQPYAVDIISPFADEETGVEAGNLPKITRLVGCKTGLSLSSVWFPSPAPPTPLPEFSGEDKTLWLLISNIYHSVGCLMSQLNQY